MSAADLLYTVSVTFSVTLVRICVMDNTEPTPSYHINDQNSSRPQDLGAELETLQVIKQGLASVIGSTGEEDCIIADLRESDGDLRVELKRVMEGVKRVGIKMDESNENWKKEKRDLECSLACLTAENRDVYNLLKIALAEKEAAERSLSKLKKENNEHKRGAILQIAERGFQKVGFSFGFMAGNIADELPSETDSGSSECEEEEPVNLASTMERIIKDLRLEITQLTRSLDEYRLETVRLQSLGELQAHRIEECTMHIKEMEDREKMLSQKVEELEIEIRETEEEVGRWRHACELEVQAGKDVSEENEKLVSILKQELEKSRAGLHASNRKMKVKDALVAAAIAAREAAERSLQLADTRAAGLRAQIEELTVQLEGKEKREQAKRRRSRHICWPWQTLKFNATYNGAKNIRLMLPEMQALVQERLNI